MEADGGRKQIKIRNFQALIDDNYNHNSGNGQSMGFVSKEDQIENQQISLNLRISTTAFEQP